MSDLFAKHRHSTEIIKTVWQEHKSSTSVTKKNKSADEHNS